MADAVFTVEMGEELYSLVTPEGVSGEPVPYEATSTVMWNGVLYYSHVDNPDDYPEDGEAPTVFRVDATTVMASGMQEVSDDEESESGDDGDGEDDDEDEDEDEEDEIEPGDVIQFPEPEEEDEDENLPPAEAE